MAQKISTQRVVLKLMKSFFNVYKYLLNYFVRFLWEPFLRPKRVKLQAIDNRLLLMPASVLADEIRRQRVSSEDVVRAYINRTRSVNAALNAMVDNRFPEAVKEAQEVDHYIQTSGKSPQEIALEKPMYGVPFTAKSNLSCKGLVLDVGLVSRRGLKGSEEADVVSRMRHAGAILLGCTNVPELCFSWNTYNRLHGQTWNPYDLARSSGGSSGGESSLVSAAASVVGLGNDLSGSLRIPACLTGIFSHKPTAGVVSNKGLYPPVTGEVNNILANGPLCRYAEDLAPMMKILSDPAGPEVDWTPEVKMADLKVYYCLDDIGFPFVVNVDEQVRSSIVKAVSYFQKQYGVKAKRISIPKIRHASWILSSKLAGGLTRPISSIMADDPERQVDVHVELAKCLVGLSNYTLPTIWFALLETISPKKENKWYPVYRKIEESVRQDLMKMLDEDNAILLFPSCPEPGVYPLEAISKMHCLVYFAMFNVLGLPVTQSPLGLSREGLPLGVQIVGGPRKDGLTIAVAQELEKAFGGWVSPCPLALLPDGSDSSDE